MDKARLFKLLGSALAIFVLVVVAAGVQQSIYSRIAAEQVEFIAASATSEANKRCPRLIVDPACLAAVKREARAEQRDEYDLYSQRVMALWSAVMGLMAIVGACLSGIGVYLVWRTWDATREAAESSRKTLRSYIARERAVLTAVNCFSTCDGDGPVDNGFKIRMKNSGLSMARLIQHNWQIVTSPVWPEKLRNTHFDDQIIFPQAEESSTFLGGDAPSTKPIEQWLVGSIYYTTLEHEIFETHYCFALRTLKLEYDPRTYYHTEQVQVAAQPRNT